jgi:hypothetical protein
LLRLAALSLATGALSLFVSRSAVMEPLRKRLPQRLRDGAQCSFCVGFWLAGIFSLAFGPAPGLPPLLSFLSTWGGAAVVAGLADPPAPSGTGPFFT